MNTNQAVQILINAVQMANTKGAYTLSESKIIADAVDFLRRPQAPVPKQPEQTKVEPKAPLKPKTK